MVRSWSSARLSADSRYWGSSAVVRALTVARAGRATRAHAVTSRPTETAARRTGRGTAGHRTRARPCRWLRMPNVPETGTVVVFLPAHNEEATVAALVGRAPTAVAGHPVTVVVVDDGSTDGTAAAAAAAGATVLSLGRNRGLGAAVREGLALAVAGGAAAVAFLDADGEYAPEELATVVGPVLAGTA